MSTRLPLFDRMRRGGEIRLSEISVNASLDQGTKCDLPTLLEPASMATALIRLWILARLG
jgi:hypothetical protein